MSARGVLINPGRLAATRVLEVLDVQALAAERLGGAQADLAEFLGGSAGSVASAPRWSRAGSGSTGRCPGPTCAHAPESTRGPRRCPSRCGPTVSATAACACPPCWWGWVVRNFDPTPRLRLPITVPVVPISIEAGRLDVGSDPGPRCPTKESR